MPSRPAASRTASTARPAGPARGAGRRSARGPRVTPRGSATGARDARWREQPAIIGPGMESGAREEIVELLSGVPLFSELSPDELDQIAQVAIPQLPPRDTCLPRGRPW